jgi:two-component system LytT family sensor kinase
MRRITKRDWIEIVIHLAFWLGVFYIVRTIGTSFVKLRVRDNGGVMQMDAKETLSPSTWLTLIFMITLFYGNIFGVFRKALRYPKFASRLAVGIGWFTLVVGIHYLLLGLLFKTNVDPAAFGSNDPRRITDERFMNDHHGSISWLHQQPLILLIFASVLGLSVAYFFLKEWSTNELLRTQLAASQYSTEIKFLKSQINPH